MKVKTAVKRVTEAVKNVYALMYNRNAKLQAKIDAEIDRLHK